MEEKLIGEIAHYFKKVSVGVLKLTKAGLKDGEKIHIKGATSDFSQKVSSMQVDHQKVAGAKKGNEVGLKVKEAVRRGDEVYKVVD